MIISVLRSDSDRILTCNLLIRSQKLYTVELRSRLLLFCLRCKGIPFFLFCKMNREKFPTFR